MDILEKRKSLVPNQIQTPACSTSLIQNMVQALVILIKSTSDASTSIGMTFPTSPVFPKALNVWSLYLFWSLIFQPVYTVKLEVDPNYMICLSILLIFDYDSTLNCLRMATFFILCYKLAFFTETKCWYVPEEVKSI